MEALWEIGEKSFETCPFNTITNSFNLGVDSIIFLIANYLQMEAAASVLSGEMLSKASQRDTNTMDGVIISVLVSIIVGCVGIVIILVYLNQHKKFKKRILMFIGRITK